jgi:hypothetical protein
MGHRKRIRIHHKVRGEQPKQILHPRRRRKTSKVMVEGQRFNKTKGTTITSAVEETTMTL